MNPVLETKMVFSYLADIMFQNGGKLLLLMIRVEHQFHVLNCPNNILIFLKIASISKENKFEKRKPIIKTQYIKLHAPKSHYVVRFFMCSNRH
jgi:hypothetical protein